MRRYFLGLDIGGTKSHALVADETGQALGFGEGGPGNPEVVGYAGLTRILCDITARALLQASLSKDQLAAVGYGVAGYDWPCQRDDFLAAIRELGFKVPFELVNDTLIGLLAGAPEGWGIAVVAGTGCNCRGWDKNRREGRVLGIGPLMGESAGGHELVLRALQAVAFEWSRRGPATALTPAFIELIGARDIEDMLIGVTTGRFHTFASAAPLVFRVAGAGDAVAQEVVRTTGRELGDMANGVIRQLEFQALEFDVVLVGSLYNGSPLLVEAMRETVHALAPGARFVRLTAPPVVGGVLLGMEQAGLEYTAVRDALIQSTNVLRGSCAEPGPSQPPV